ncbi:hypothetical protein A4A49_65654, partial [Nicotiana attenuata]
DPTLQLPDHLLHLIFSFVGCRDLVNVSLVSKNWHRNTPSYFAFNFDESLFFQKISIGTHNKFKDWILSSLETCKSKLIKAEKKVLRVYLRFGSLSNSLPYIFQPTCLTVLHLTHCTIKENIFRGEEKFDSWQELKLVGVTLSGETLSKFISKCPNIRELSLEGCKDISFIVLRKLVLLKKLYVKKLHTYSRITNIEVIAPNLQVFHFVDRSVSKFAVKIDIRACRMLQEFHLDCLKF